MSLTDSIGVDVQSMTAGVARAQQEAAAADHGVEQIAARAVASGFVGITAGLARVRQMIGQARSRLTEAADVLGEASRAVGSVGRQPSPQETIAALTPAIAALTTAEGSVTAAASAIMMRGVWPRRRCRAGSRARRWRACSRCCRSWPPSAFRGLRPGNTSTRHWHRPDRSVTWETSDGRRKQRPTARHTPSSRRCDTTPARSRWRRGWTERATDGGCPTAGRPRLGTSRSGDPAQTRTPRRPPFPASPRWRDPAHPRRVQRRGDLLRRR